jgi:hypothetical protein
VLILVGSPPTAGHEQQKLATFGRQIAAEKTERLDGLRQQREGAKAETTSALRPSATDRFWRTTSADGIGRRLGVPR